jgi:hypothetical protein
MNLSYNKVKLLFVIWNEIFLNHRVVPNDSHENLLDFYPDVNEQEIGISISEMNLSD